MSQDIKSCNCCCPESVAFQLYDVLRRFQSDDKNNPRGLSTMDAKKLQEYHRDLFIACIKASRGVVDDIPDLK